MSRPGQWSAIGAVVLGVITVATWNLGAASALESRDVRDVADRQHAREMIYLT